MFSRSFSYVVKGAVQCPPMLGARQRLTSLWLRPLSSLTSPLLARTDPFTHLAVRRSARLLSDRSFPAAGSAQPPVSTNSEKKVHAASSEESALPSERELKEKLLELVGNTRVVLFMKGSPERPLCGFSARAVRLLEVGGVEEFTFVDCAAFQPPETKEAGRAATTEDPGETSQKLENAQLIFEKKRRLREAVRAAFDWPTLPLVVVDGEVVGGADILQSLHERGELKKVLGTITEDTSPASDAPAESKPDSSSSSR